MDTILICLYVAMVIATTALLAGLIDPTSIRCKSRRHVATYLGIPLMLCFLFTSVLSEGVAERKARQKYVEEHVREIIEDPVQNAYYGMKAREAYAAYGENRKSTAEARQEKKEVLPVGQAARADGFAYTVRNFSFIKSFGDGFGSTADGIYLIVNLSIKNLSDEPCRFPFDGFYITDPDGSRYTFQDYVTSLFRSEASGITDWDFDKFNGLRMFQPNVPTRDCLLFEVPQRGRYYLNFSGSPTVVALE